LDLKVGSDPSAAEVIKAIAAAERKYQEELNRGFAGLSEGAFKGLRRQLPVTRQKVEWEKVGSYRVGYVSAWLTLDFLIKLTNLAAKILVVAGQGRFSCTAYEKGWEYSIDLTSKSRSHRNEVPKGLELVQQ
jgi:hypothetical protein